MAKPMKYTVSDGKLVLTLEVAEEGGYLVTSPLDPDILTEADTVEEAFEMARDVIALYKAVRADMRKAAAIDAKERPTRKKATAVSRKRAG